MQLEHCRIQENTEDLFLIRVTSSYVFPTLAVLNVSVYKAVHFKINLCLRTSQGKARSGLRHLLPFAFLIVMCLMTAASNSVIKDAFNCLVYILERI